jgi:predicted nucleic acid-binding protein
MIKQPMEHRTIYLDACCLNRLFDDQTQDRVRLETESILLVLKLAQEKKVKLVGSEVLIFELQQTPNFSRRLKLLSLLQYIHTFVKVTPRTKSRAERLRVLGMKPFDAFHTAVAEKGKVQFLLTTDDEMVKLYQQHKKFFHTQIYNPLTWIKEYQLV